MTLRSWNAAEPVSGRQPQGEADGVTPGGFFSLVLPSALAMRVPATDGVSSSAHRALDAGDRSVVVHHGLCGNLKLDRLTVLVTANGRDGLRQCLDSGRYVIRKALPVAGMRGLRNDQFQRASDGLAFSESEQLLGGGVPMKNDPVPIDSHDGGHDRLPVQNARAVTSHPSCRPPSTRRR